MLFNQRTFYSKGAVNENISINQVDSTTIPLKFKANLFGVSEEKNGVEKVLSDMLTRDGNDLVVLKIKPAFNIGGRTILYPGYRDCKEHTGILPIRQCIL